VFSANLEPGRYLSGDRKQREPTSEIPEVLDILAAAHSPTPARKRLALGAFRENQVSRSQTPPKSVHQLVFPVISGHHMSLPLPMEQF
jgi:hypothetical protein